jgi:hypothetical protein
VCNFTAAVELRIGKSVPDPAADVSQRWLEFCSFMLPYCYDRPDQVDDCSIDEFVAGKPGKLKRRVFEALADRSRRDWRHGSNSTFVKVDMRGGPVKYKPRVISSVEPNWVALVGPWLHSIDCWIRDHPCFGHAKFLTPWQVAEWFQARGYEPDNRQFSFFDFSGFDLHCTTVHFRFEAMFLRFFGVPLAVVDKLTSSELFWTGYRHTEEGFMMFRSEARCRQSGDPQTSCCNNAIAIMLHLFAVVETYRRLHDLPCDWYRRSSWLVNLQFVEMLNNGDDCVMYRPIASPDLGIYLQLGMELDTKHGEFCQCSPLISDSCCLMVRHPREFLTRIGFTTTNYPAGDCLLRRQHLHMISVANSQFCTGVPVHWAVVKAGLRLGASGRDLDLDLIKNSSWTLYTWLQNSGIRSVEPQPPSMSSRLAYSAVFGISVCQQLELEEAILSLTSPFSKLALPWLDSYLQAEWGGQDAHSLLFHSEL